jgi:hypothetical protein
MAEFWAWFDGFVELPHIGYMAEQPVIIIDPAA